MVKDTYRCMLKFRSLKYVRVRFLEKSNSNSMYATMISSSNGEFLLV